MATHSAAKRGAKKQVDAIVGGDLNMAAAALLYDMAALQGTERSQFGYKRAAKAIVGLPVSIKELVAAGALRDVPFIGPSSARIIQELVAGGGSPTVDAAVAKASRPSKVMAAREYRTAYLSHFAMQQALSAPLGTGVVSRGEYRGDFQMHSSWSDGSERIGVMADAAQALGHTCLGITDHSYGLPIAHGMSMADVERQHREIDVLNAGYEGRFRVFKGIEANILADGSLDVQPAECALFEFIVASPHSLLRRPEDQTGRMLGAIRTRGVTILGHPRGRMFNSRPGVAADWDRVFEEAAKRRVAVELDGNWHRQDIDFELAGRALAAGCIFALDSDAHSTRELRFSEYAVAHARLALIPAERVINCWSNEELDAWMAARRRPARRS
ncbi:MAG: PHP domain-containing protein [Acidobacteriota bacterium]|nr:PHP domain-containing protein [Acidobacteriota bacterium]